MACEVIARSDPPLLPDGTLFPREESVNGALGFQAI